MKKYVILIALAIVPVLPLDADSGCCDDDDASNSFMFTRPITQNLSTRQALWWDIIHNKGGEFLSSVNITAMYQQSLPLFETDVYFAPSCCTDGYIVSGDKVIDNISRRKIRAEWINLPSTFNGTFSLSPVQKQAGVVFEFNQDLRKFSDASFFENSWVGIYFPLLWVENDMRLREHDYSPTFTVSNCCCPTNPQTIAQAFRQVDWHFAKICGRRSIVSLGDINIQIGKTFLSRDHFLVAEYTTLYIPTGNIQDGQSLFEPVAGNNGHFGFGTGVSFQILMNRDDSHFAACWFINLESVFLARNRQFRSFDLINKPYSRYLQLVRENDPTATRIPAVNILTQWVQVHPYNLADLSTGLRLKTARTELELGYSIWGHGTEKIDFLCDKFPLGYGIAGNQLAPNEDPAIYCGHFAPATASKSTIACLAENDVIMTNCLASFDQCVPLLNADGNAQRVFIPILPEDLRLRSAAGESAFNHKFQMSFGFAHHVGNVDLFFGAGLYYDKPVKNGALNLLGGWAKWGASF